MTKLVAVVVGSLALVVGQPLIAQHWSEAAAQIPLPSGQFSFSAQGSFGTCISNAGAPESCSTSGAVVLALTGLANGSFTFDSTGNGCGVTSEVDSFPLAPIYLGPPPFPGYPPFPALFGSPRHVVTKVIVYDSATGIGDRSQTIYSGGTCNGANFNSGGAPVAGVQTVHFVVTNGGNRIDGFPTSNVAYVSSTDHSNFLADFSVSATDTRQTTENQQ